MAVSDNPPSTKKPIQKVSPNDKPLPSPPVAQLYTSNEYNESKSLIDASDKPLRLSPTGMSEHKQDWPVLQPRRPASPGTLQEMLRETGSQLTQQAASGEKERYPVLGNTLRQVQDEDQLPVSRYSTMYKIPRKEVSSPDIDKLANVKEKSAAAAGELSSSTGKIANADKLSAPDNTHLDDPFKDGIYDSEPPKPSQTLSTSPSNLSAGAAAVEKSAHELRAPIEPRQTRTSSLRARLSAGQLVKQSQSKVVGFTDFTATDDPVVSAGRRGSLRARKEAQARRSITPPAKPVPHPLQTKPSRESIGGIRAPAQFVAGSRRPAHPRRPSSRGSLRNESRGPTPPLPGPPSRPAPTRPAPEAQVLCSAISSESQIEPRTSPRKSSIPVLRQAVSTAQSHGNQEENDRQDGSRVTVGAPDGPDVSGHKDSGHSHGKKVPRDEFAIFKQHSSAQLVEYFNRTRLAGYSLPAQPLVDHEDARVLEAIEESPQNAYRLKRLSMNSPEIGPTLKISPSAERFIMGPKENDTKEGRPLNNKKSKDLDRALIKRGKHELKSHASSVSESKKLPERPSSSQGLSQVGSRAASVGPRDREKKVKSADMGILSPVIDRLLNGSHKPTGQPSDQNTDKPAKASKSSTHTFNDPFFDAFEEPQSGPDKEDIEIYNDEKCQPSSAVTEDQWISPLKFKPDSAIVPPAPELLTLEGHAEQAVKDLKAHLSTTDPFQNSGVITKDFVQEPKDNKPADRLPSTPEQHHTKDAPNSGLYPPRSSSRMAHPDYPSSKKSAPSPLANSETPSGPSKGFTSARNNLGSIGGHGTPQVDNSTSNNQAFKRDSAARDSNKSQGSVSKGMLSNIRGLFNKRSSEKEPLKSSKKAKKIPTTSPSNLFPPISEVHPIHRPTLASVARSNATINNTPRLNAPATPAYASPGPSEVSATTTLAMQLLDSAREERSSPKKEKLLELGKIMVEAITQARDAEKAMEHAKQAARKAEVANALCKKSLGEVTRCVREWSKSG